MQVVRDTAAAHGLNDFASQFGMCGFERIVVGAVALIKDADKINDDVRIVYSFNQCVLVVHVTLFYINIGQYLQITAALFVPRQYSDLITISSQIYGQLRADETGAAEKGYIVNT